MGSMTHALATDLKFVIGSPTSNSAQKEQIDFFAREIADEIKVFIEETRTKPNRYLANKIRKYRNEREKHIVAFYDNLHSSRGVANSDYSHTIFSYIWQLGMNYACQVCPDAQGNDLDGDEDFNFAESEQQISEEMSNSYSTVLLNILLRQKDCNEKAQKVHTLLRAGADKNQVLNETEEVPLIVLSKFIPRGEERLSILKLFLNDDSVYSENDVLDKSKIESIKKSLQDRDIQLQFAIQLIEQNDYHSFDEVLAYCEKNGVQLATDSRNSELAQIRDQLESPIFEYILKKMINDRDNATTTVYDPDRKLQDNIEVFLNLPELEINSANPGQFGYLFQHRINNGDFDPNFEKASEVIQRDRDQSQIRGDEFKDIFKSYVRYINFRNKMASHLNRVALTYSHRAKDAYTVKLLRYLNKFDGSQGYQKKLFKELSVYDGLNLIFLQQNDIGWTPLHYAMARKNQEVVKFLSHMGIRRLNEKDSLGNNLCHVAFPQSYEGNEDSDFVDENPLDKVSVAVGCSTEFSETKVALAALLKHKNADEDDIVEALTEVSSSKFTPVGLAAITGNAEAYELLKSQLQAYGKWNSEDHCYLGQSVEDLYEEGLIKNLDGMSDMDKQKAIILRDKLARSNEKRRRTAVSDIWDKHMDKDSIEGKRYNYLMKLVNDEIGHAASQSAMNRRGNHYNIALTKVVDALSSAIGRRSTPDWIKRKNVMYGMKEATSDIKASYLRPVMQRIVKKYIESKNTDMTVQKVYQGITASDTMDYFQSRFSRKIEKDMQGIIHRTLASAGKLRMLDSDGNEIRSENPFAVSRIKPLTVHPHFSTMDGLKASDNEDDIVVMGYTSDDSE